MCHPVKNKLGDENNLKEQELFSRKVRRNPLTGEIPMIPTGLDFRNTHTIGGILGYRYPHQFCLVQDPAEFGRYQQLGFQSQRVSSCQPHFLTGTCPAGWGLAWPCCHWTVGHARRNNWLSIHTCRFLCTGRGGRGTRVLNGSALPCKDGERLWPRSQRSLCNSSCTLFPLGEGPCCWRSAHWLFFVQTFDRPCTPEQRRLS